MLVDLQPKSTAPTWGRLHHKKVAEAAGDLAYLCAATALHLRNCAAEGATGTSGWGAAAALTLASLLDEIVAYGRAPAPPARMTRSRRCERGPPPPPTPAATRRAATQGPASGGFRLPRCKRCHRDDPPRGGRPASAPRRRRCRSTRSGSSAADQGAARTPRPPRRLVPASAGDECYCPRSWLLKAMVGAGDARAPAWRTWSWRRWAAAPWSLCHCPT